MSQFDFSVLIIGAGSIGQRHLRNLYSLGIRKITVCDVDKQRLKIIDKELPVKIYTDYEKALKEEKPDLTFVCTPPVFHLEPAMCALNAGTHVFIEKPLSHNLEGIDELLIASEKSQKIVQIGYNLRFHPGLQIIKKFLDEHEIGRVLWAYVEFGQYLPDWRPWQDYRRNYTARSELGGGILLDASHELDYITWMLGIPCEVMCMTGKISNLDVDVEDCATILLRFADGSQANVHMDFIQRGYERSCKLVGESGTIKWNFSTNEVNLYSVKDNSWQSFPYRFSINDMYIEEIKHFMQCVQSSKSPLVEIKQAKIVLEVVLASKKAAISGVKQVLYE